MVHLRQEFENFSRSAQSLCLRWSRGLYRDAIRSAEPSLVDSRGPNVRALEMAQTFLNDSQVDELLVLYKGGMTMAQVAERFDIDRHTVARHLEHRGVPARVRGLKDEHLSEAVRLYESGSTLMEIGRRFGASGATVRRANAAEGVTIRPRGRNRHLAGKA